MSRDVFWTERETFMADGVRRIVDADVVLDIGCGIRPHTYITPSIYICAEPYAEYVEVLKKTLEGNTDSVFVILEQDWETTVNQLSESSIDTVFLLDVIEHLGKDTGKRLLEMTEKIARRQIIVFTPLGFVEQHTLPDGKDAWGLNGAAWQEHKSGWLPDDFDDSWDVVACKDFHQVNNIGGKLDEPFGALWAIKNLKKETQPRSACLRYSDDLAEKIFEQSKEVFSLLQQKNKRLNDTKLGLENANQILEQKRLVAEEAVRRLESENSVLEQRVKVLEDEKLELQKLVVKLEEERTGLKQETLSVRESNLLLKQENRSLDLQNQTFKKRYRIFETIRKSVKGT